MKKFLATVSTVGILGASIIGGNASDGCRIINSYNW